MKGLTSCDSVTIKHSTPSLGCLRVRKEGIEGYAVSEFQHDTGLDQFVDKNCSSLLVGGEALFKFESEEVAKAIM